MDGIASARIAAAPDKNPSKIEPGCHNFAFITFMQRRDY